MPNLFKPLFANGNRRLQWRTLALILVGISLWGGKQATSTRFPESDPNQFEIFSEEQQQPMPQVEPVPPPIQTPKPPASHPVPKPRPPQ